MITTPFDDIERDVAHARWLDVSDELRRASRNRLNRRLTGEIWDGAARGGVTAEQIEAAMLDFYGVSCVPEEHVAKYHRIALGCAAAPVARRESFYSELEAVDDARVGEALKLAIEAQAVACMAGRASEWLDGDDVLAAAQALAEHEGHLDGRLARGFLAAEVRERIIEFATGATSVGEAA